MLIRPMLATPAPLPSAAEDRQWAYEVKWDGVRAVAYLQDGQLRLMSRTDRDITRRYPELAALAASLPDEAVVLDGELVSLDADGRPSFGRLQHRMHAVDQAEIRRLVGRYPVTYMIFDLLHADGQSLLGQPYMERRTRLTQLNPTGPAWQTPPSWIGGGPDILAATAEQGLEGIIAKRLTSTYQPGRRSPAWRKIKNIRTVDVLIGGWSPAAAAAPAPSARCWSECPHRTVWPTSATSAPASPTPPSATCSPASPRLEIPTSPFDAVAVPHEFARSARWVRPELGGEVAYAEIGLEGRLRHPRWRGLRER